MEISNYFGTDPAKIAIKDTESTRRLLAKAVSIPQRFYEAHGEKVAADQMMHLYWSP